MKLPSRIELAAAVSILAIGIPAIAYAFPGHHQYKNTNSVTTPRTEQTSTQIDTPNPSDYQKYTNTDQHSVQKTTTTPQIKQAVDVYPQNGQVRQNYEYHNGHTGMNDGYHYNGQTNSYNHHSNTGAAHQSNHGMGHE